VGSVALADAFVPLTTPATWSLVGTTLLVAAAGRVVRKPSWPPVDCELNIVAVPAAGTYVGRRAECAADEGREGRESTSGMGDVLVVIETLDPGGGPSLTIHSAIVRGTVTTLASSAFDGKESIVLASVVSAPEKDVANGAKCSSGLLDTAWFLASFASGS